MNVRGKTLHLIWALLAATPAVAAAAEALKFSDVAGWWAAEPSYAGESSRVLLHFVEENGRPSVRLSLLGIGGYDVPIGAVVVAGDMLDMQPYPFPLKYDAARDVLSGRLPQAAVPVYRIPVEFHRIRPVPRPAPPTWNSPRPRIKWTYATGAPVWAGLAYDAATGLLYIGDDQGVLHAIDLAGKLRWRFNTGKPIKARPAVVGKALYVASDSGFLYRLDARTGQERWRADIDQGGPARISASQEGSRWDRYGSSVVADASRVYAASRDKHLYALDAASGEERWRVAAQDIMTATPALYRDLIVFAAFDGVVQAVTAKDGEPRWRYEAKAPVAGDLVVDGDRVFAGSRTYELIALDAASGQELWKHYYWFSWIESPPVVRDGVVYTGSSDATSVYAVNVRDGSRRWRTSVPGWAWARTAVGDDTVVAATVGRGPYPGVRAGSLVGLDRASGVVRWVYLDEPSQAAIDGKADWGFGASPLLVDGVVYAADLNGRVIAVAAAP